MFTKYNKNETIHRNYKQKHEQILTNQKIQNKTQNTKTIKQY